MKHLFFLLGILLSFSSIAQLYQVPVYAVTALQPAQPGNEVSKFVDGDLSTMYHSDWYQNGIPDELNFYFSSNVQSIKKIIYTPRQDGTTNGMWTVVTISYSTLENPETFLVLEENLQWELNPSVKEFELETALYHPYRIKFEVSAGKGDFSSGAEMQFFSEEEVFQNGSTDCAISTDLLSVNGENDSKAIIQGNGSYASEYQQGENIERSFDDNIGTLYHSSWSNTQFPVELNYRFDGITPLDYFKYTPRQDGGNNGNFGEVSISYNTSENETYQPLIDIDFGFSGIPSISYFPQEITPLNIKFTVYTGANGFVSCAEMAFFKQGTNEANDYDYSAIFTDDLAYELQNMITQNDIDTISSPFYQTLAQCIFDETYQKESRLRSYEVFPPIQSTSSMLKVGTYNPFENATGIAFEAGEKIALFVEHLPLNKTVQLAIKDFASSFDGAVSYYSLKNGLNVFEVENDGLGYISYFDDDETLENISINIVSGKINGVFNRATSTNSDWIEFLEYDAYPYLDIIGEFVHLVYEKQALRDVNPLKGLELVGKYDTIVQHERMLMGLFKYDKSPKNRQLTYSDRGGGWWAGGLGVHLDLEWGEAGVVHPNALDLWGIPHEYGHINQIRPDLNWIGTTEVTNNVYSVWVQYHMNHEGNSYSRMEEEWVNPSNNMPATYGGRMNGTILNTFIEGQALQETDDVFEILVPF